VGVQLEVTGLGEESRQRSRAQREGSLVGGPRPTDLGTAVGGLAEASGECRWEVGSRGKLGTRSPRLGGLMKVLRIHPQWPGPSKESAGRTLIPVHGGEPRRPPRTLQQEGREAVGDAPRRLSLYCSLPQQG